MRTGIATLILTLLTYAVPAASEVYRTVDENGNIVYSDKPLSNESESMDLPPLSIIEPTPLPASRPPVDTQDDEPPAPYADLRFVQPEPEVNLWGTAATLEFVLNSSMSLRPGHELVVLLDGEERYRGISLSGSIDEIVRGEHRVVAQIQNDAGEVVASAGPVVFYMKQQSALNPNNPQNRPRPQPTGGG